MDRMVQNARLIAHLKAGNDISVAEAPATLGIGCLTKRVSECREAGYDIRAIKIEENGRFGKVRYNRYYLGKEA